MSERVGWDAVREYVHRVLADLNHTGLPVAGTPEWCALPDDDPIKLAAVLAAGSRWVLEQELDRLEDQRTAVKAAAVAVAESRVWADVARRVQNRAEFNRENPDLRRRSA